jgi:mono/diheme cytochrome c family protein
MRPLRWLLMLLLGVGVALAIAAVVLRLLGMPSYEVALRPFEVAGTPEERAHGKALTAVLCRRCHFDRDLRGLAGAALEDAPPRLGRIFAPNLTRDLETGLGSWSLPEVAWMLRTGIHPRSGELTVPVMPRWPRMADADVAAIAAFLASDDPWVAPREVRVPRTEPSFYATWLGFSRWEPHPYPTAAIARPPISDPIAYGQYLVDDVYQCGGCHRDAQDDPFTIDPKAPGYLGGGAPMRDAAGEGVHAANLTPAGLRDWTVDDLRVALVDGFRPDGSLVRWPMPRHLGLGTAEVEAIWAYLRELPPVSRSVLRAPRRVVGERMDAGRHVYERLGCPSCHGHDGADLRAVAEHFDDDAAIAAFVRNPGQRDPWSTMPAWRDRVSDEELSALVAHLRALAATGS